MRRSPAKRQSEQVVVSSFSARMDEHKEIEEMAKRLGMSKSMFIVEAAKYYKHNA